MRTKNISRQSGKRSFHHRHRRPIQPRPRSMTSLNPMVPPISRARQHLTIVCADAPKKVDAENGNDTLLVEWYGPTDPDVSYHCVMLVPGLLTGIVITSESAELVEREESMGDVSDMSSDIHHLRRSCHLHCWNPVHNIRIPREHCRSDSGSHTLHRQLRNWCVIFSIFFQSILVYLTDAARSYALGTLERGTTNWPHARLHLNACRFRRPPSPNCTRYQLRYADGLPFPQRILRLPDPRDGWRDRRRSRHIEEACVRNDPLGCIRRIRTKSWTTPREFLRTFLPRDLRVQYPLPSRAPSP